MTQKFAVRSS